jgi:two-component system, LytTR family, response regulator
MRLLIVDDEPLARSAMVRLCEQSEGVSVVGEAGSGAAAIQAAEQLCPDVMLIDVELPDMSGFEVLRGARVRGKPLGIMVCAHSDHALAAFAAGALDYLVKPVNSARLADSFERARHHCDSEAAASRRTPQLLIGQHDRRLYPLSAESIDYIESNGNYVTIYAASSKYTSRDSIKRLSADLAALGFVRIGRSLLVNIRAVSFVETAGRGTFKFTLSSGSSLYSSASCRNSILGVLPMRRLSNRSHAN